MSRIGHRMPGMFVGMLMGILLTLFALPAMAQLSIKLIAPDGKTLDVTGRNQARGMDSLILYDHAYGKSTRTNAYGVEVIAVPAATPVTDGKAYTVTAVQSVWECAKNTQVVCGNASIPENGVVLSAAGMPRDWLKTLKPGDIVVLQEQWFHQGQARLDVINPTVLNNPMAAGFPGYRASNQIVAYDAGYGRPTTGTNEFGFEVTVRNGIVTAQEGSDSAIPPDGFVLSGHGRGRSWLIRNTPLGAKVEISPTGQSIVSTVDFDTYLYQFDQRWAQSPCAGETWSGTAGKPAPDSICETIRADREKAVRLFQAGHLTDAASTIRTALGNMSRRIWMSYQPFDKSTIRGVWHRPVEKTPAAIGQTLDKLKSAGINTVFLETFFHGYTIFPSKTFETYGLPVENPKFAGTDLLALWVEEAHKRHMTIHTWFQTFYGGTRAYLPPGPILTKYPNWANVQYSALQTRLQPLPPVGAAAGMPMETRVTATAAAAPVTGQGNMPVPVQEIKLAPDHPVPSTLELGGYFLDPANPEVKTFLLRLIDEIVTRYDIDGFQLDYIRYPASFPADRFSYRKTTWGYTDVARKAFKAQYGVDPVDIDPKNPRFQDFWQQWNNWKASQISNFVAKASRQIHQKKSGLKISAAVFPDAESALTLKHQDWRAWALNGWIDFYAPMTLTSAIKVVERDTRNMISATQGKVPVYSGIFGPFNNNSAEHVLSQIDSAKQAGANGYVLFDTAHLDPMILEALKILQIPASSPEAITPKSEEVKPAAPETVQPTKTRRKFRFRKRKHAPEAPAATESSKTQ